MKAITVTVKDRLNDARSHLELVSAAILVEANRGSDGEDMMRAALRAVGHAIDELYYVDAALTQEMQAHPAPDGD